VRKPRPKRRFHKHAVPLTKVITLPEDHPAVTEGRTLFASTVREPTERDWLLKSAEHNRKIGSHVTKGKLAGFPIYSLTLEERASCPRSCEHWRSCYGNHQHWNQRWVHGPALVRGLEVELEYLSLKHKQGFLIRLHALGDFWSVGYVRAWERWLRQFEPLHVYGYSAWKRGSRIGNELIRVRDANWDRFAIRLSNSGEPEKSANTIWYQPNQSVTPEGIVCPAQVSKTETCGTCALCWTTTRNIAFLAH